MSRRKHVPVRSCLGCGKVDRQVDMIRLVRAAAGRLVVDSTRRMGGRGGYLHQTEDCWDRFARRKGMVRSFRMVVDRDVRLTVLAGMRSSIER